MEIVWKQAPTIWKTKSVYFFFMKQHLLQYIYTSIYRHVNTVLRWLKSPHSFEK